MSFTIKAEHCVVASEISPQLGFLTFRSEEGMFAFLRDNKPTVRIANVHENLDVDFNYTLTITPKKTA